MQIMNPIFPSRFKVWGIIFICISLIFAFLLFYLGFKPSWLEIRVFAVFSFYIEARFMKFMHNSMMEEIAAMLFISGFAMLSFSRERDEKPEYQALRFQALSASLYAYWIFIALAILFTFGFAFMYMLMIAMALPFILYYIIFQIKLRKYRSSSPPDETQLTV